jgi:hypothetical protein
MIKYTLYILLLISLIGCKSTDNAPKYTAQDAEYMHQCEKELTDIIVTDIFSPPVASRVYVYPIIAAYEAGYGANPQAKSLLPQLKGFDAPPSVSVGQNYDFTLAAVVAFCTTADKVIFSKAQMTAFKEGLIKKLSARNDNETNKRSIAYGEAVAAVVSKRTGSDNYKETRGMERYIVQPNVLGRWVPTLPDYADAVEPHWGKMKTLVLDTAAQCLPPRPPQYSTDKNSPFWKEIMEVYDLGKVINDSHENNEIATFWDDNPFVSRHKGHLMFQDKKMTPGGHWLAITQLICKEKQADFVLTLKANVLTALALHEAFISCWDEKYRSAKVRPETIIKDQIVKDWKPWLVTPPFPAYTSGHSTISAAAAEVLTALFGDNIAYTDTTEKEYGLPVRSFKSFRQAAEEASISRVLAGIHFRSDCELGNVQGKKVGEIVITRVKL